MTILVNGVFKGGGAKGIGYAGALQAVEARGMWFGAVAGTSAGAITAALIAAGYCADAIRAAVPGLLMTVKHSWTKMILGLQDGIFDNRHLGSALEVLLRDKVPGDPASPVTFKDLYRSQITLYVVALDLATSSPIVFSVHTTPDLSVTSAVLASSAIPGAFPSARAVNRTKDGYASRRLVDGGAWANFPRFVFQDASFQEWIRTATSAGDAEESSKELSDERSRKTLHFALGTPHTSVPFRPDWIEYEHSGPASFDKGTLQSARNPFLWAFGTTLSNTITRLIILVALAGIVVAFGLGIRREFRGLWTWFADDPTGVSPVPLALGATATVLSAFCIALLFLVMLAFSRTIGSTLLPAARSALAVGTGVAPWVGAGATDYLIMVPYDGLATAKFQVKPQLVGNAVREGRAACESQLAEHFDGQVPAAAEPDVPAEPERNPAPGFWAAILSTVLLGLSAYLIAEGILAENMGLATFAGIAVGVVWVVVTGLHTAKVHSGVSLGASFPGITGRPGRIRFTLIFGVIVTVLGVGGAILALQHYRDSREAVTISQIDTTPDLSTGTSLTLYTYQPDRPDEFRDRDFQFASDAHLSVGERIHLVVDPSEPQVRLDANDSIYLLPFKAVQLLGLFLVIFGYWMRQVRRRQKRLAKCVGSRPLEPTVPVGLTMIAGNAENGQGRTGT